MTWAASPITANTSVEIEHHLPRRLLSFQDKARRSYKATLDPDRDGGRCHTQSASPPAELHDSSSSRFIRVAHVRDDDGGLLGHDGHSNDTSRSAPSNASLVL